MKCELFKFHYPARGRKHFECHRRTWTSRCSNSITLQGDGNTLNESFAVFFAFLFKFHYPQGDGNSNWYLLRCRGYEGSIPLPRKGTETKFLLGVSSIVFKFHYPARGRERNFFFVSCSQSKEVQIPLPRKEEAPEAGGGGLATVRRVQIPLPRKKIAFRRDGLLRRSIPHTPQDGKQPGICVPWCSRRFKFHYPAGDGNVLYSLQRVMVLIMFKFHYPEGDRKLKTLMNIARQILFKFHYPARDETHNSANVIKIAFKKFKFHYPAGDGNRLTKPLRVPNVLVQIPLPRKGTKNTSENQSLTSRLYSFNPLPRKGTETCLAVTIFRGGKPTFN